MSAEPSPTWTAFLALGRTLASGLLHLIYPASCYVCQVSLSPDGGLLCPKCRDALTSDPHDTCPCCAATIGPFAEVSRGCTRCRGLRFAFDQAIRLGYYEGLLREVILQMKHASGEGLAELLAELWTERDLARFRALGAEVVVPVPLHWLRRWRRGYNQSEALARVVADRLGIPCWPHGLRRVRNTPIQPSQSLAARRDNVRGAFQAGRAARWQGRAVLLIDDVMTTGSTADEAARALRDAGASRVSVAVLARSHG